MLGHLHVQDARSSDATGMLRPCVTLQVPHNDAVGVRSDPVPCYKVNQDYGVGVRGDW